MSKIEIAAKQKESNIYISRKRDNSNTIMYLLISNFKSFTMNTDLQNLSRNANMTFDDIDFCILCFTYQRPHMILK